MADESVGKLVDRWINDPAFRTRMRQDPEETIRASGVRLSAAQWEAVRKVDWSQSDQELQALASKPTL